MLWKPSEYSACDILFAGTFKEEGDDGTGVGLLAQFKRMLDSLAEQDLPSKKQDVAHIPDVLLRFWRAVEHARLPDFGPRVLARVEKLSQKVWAPQLALNTCNPARPLQGSLAGTLLRELCSVFLCTGATRGRECMVRAPQGGVLLCSNCAGKGIT